MSRISQADELTAHRRYDEFRENIQDACDAMNTKYRFRRVAANVYISLAGIWKLNRKDAARPLSISDLDYAVWQGGKFSGLGVVGLEKISYLLGIYRYFVASYSENINRVSSWLCRPKFGDVFAGKRPYELLAGPYPEVLYSVRRDLAAATV